MCSRRWSFGDAVEPDRSAVAFQSVATPPWGRVHGLGSEAQKLIRRKVDRLVDADESQPDPKQQSGRGTRVTLQAQGQADGDPDDRVRHRSTRRRRRQATAVSAAAASLVAASWVSPSAAGADPSWYGRSGPGNTTVWDCTTGLCIAATKQVQMYGGIYYVVQDSGLFNFYKDRMETTIKGVGTSSSYFGCILPSSQQANHYWVGGSSSRPGTVSVSAITSTNDSYLGRYTADYKEANLSSPSARMRTLVGTIGNYCIVGTTAWELQYKG